MQTTSHITTEQALATLGHSPDFRALQRLAMRDAFTPVTSDTPVLIGVAIDCETTSLSHHFGWARELALIRFEYTADGQVVRVLDRYQGWEDVGAPLPRIDPILCDRHYRYFDEKRIAAMLQDVSIVIAHNAVFDRPFFEDRFPCFQELVWGCSYQDVNWRQAGISSGKLEYLATHFGFFYDAHQAAQDCQALLEILSRPLPHHSHSVLKAVLNEAAIPRVRLWAENAQQSGPCLKLRGYRWGPNKACHYSSIAQNRLAQELAWLQAHVYPSQGGHATITVEPLPPQLRFADRRYPSRSRTCELNELLQEVRHGQAC